MSIWPTLWRSSVGKKAFMAVTGLAMVLFLIGHLGGNLLLFTGRPELFNAYSHKLISLGPLLYLIELGLLAFFVTHIVSGVSVALDKRRARPAGYAVERSKGGPSRQTFSSRTMILSGLVLLIFTAVHLKTFKYGPDYRTTLDGVEVRDLYRLVVEKFSRGHELYVLFYVGAMLFLGFHLRHGFWSAFQSLGVQHPRWTGLIYTAGIGLAALLAAGFLAMPIFLYFRGGAP
jgi:succinate dehydrogenase / fumarate reductase cytochrome b subunit